MPQARGVGVILAFKAGATWGTWNTGVNAANLGMLCKTYALSWGREELPDTSYNAQSVIRQSTDVGRSTGSLTFGLDVRYEYLQTLMALFFGTGGAPTLQTTGYRHTTYAPTHKTGVFGSAMIDDGSTEYRLHSVIPTGITIKGTAGRRLEAEVRCIFDQMTLAASGASSSVTIGGNVDYVKMTPASVLTYKIGTQGGTPAAVSVQNWTYQADWEIAADDRAYTSTAAPHIDQPGTGRFKSSLQLTKLRDATTYLPTALDAGTIYEAQLDHVLTTNEKEWKLRFPSLKLVSATGNPSDYGYMNDVLTFTCDRDTAGASTFNVAKVPYLMNVNSINADPLAT